MCSVASRAGSRDGAIVVSALLSRHHELGFRANAVWSILTFPMTAWATSAGFAEEPAVAVLYRRPRVGRRLPQTCSA